MVKQSKEDSEPNVKLIVLSAIAILGLIILLLIIIFSGSNEGFVSGKVTLDDLEVSDSRIVFELNTENAEGPIPSQSNDNGQYLLFGNNGKGVTPGSYKVTVTKMMQKNRKELSGEDQMNAENKGLLTNILPKQYESMAKTPLNIQIKSGKNIVNLELKTKG